MRTDIELKVEDGTILRGYLRVPESGESAQGIVMAHGFSGVKEQIDHYAEAFADAGFSVLVYDHRGFGESDGTPRQEVDPYRQLADWRDVLTLVSDHPAFDTEKGLGIWGSSFAGGIAIVLAANDPRVSCVVAQIPYISGHLNSRQMFSPPQRRRFEEALDEDRRARLRGEPPAMVPVFTTDPNELCALPPVVSERFIESGYEHAKRWRNEVTLRSVEHLMDFEPIGWIEHVAPTPLLMIVGERDNCTFPEVQLLAYEKAREPKQAVVHRGGHFQTYAEPHFEQTSAAALEWFAKHL